MKFIKKRVICTHCAILGPHKTHTVLLLTELKDKNNKRIKQISDEKRKIELYKELLETENFSDILKKKIDEKIICWKEETEDLYHVNSLETKK